MLKEILIAAVSVVICGQVVSAQVNPDPGTPQHQAPISDQLEPIPTERQTADSGRLFGDAPKGWNITIFDGGSILVQSHCDYYYGRLSGKVTPDEMTADALLAGVFGELGVSDVRDQGMKRTVKKHIEWIEGMVSVTDKNGKPTKAWVRVFISRTLNQEQWNDVTFAIAPEAAWQGTEGQTLVKLARSFESAGKGAQETPTPSAPSQKPAPAQPQAPGSNNPGTKRGY